jgi:hypothetical protein
VLSAGLGVDGDAHCGVTVKHRSRVARNPAAPNLRQVHLIPAELQDAAPGGFCGGARANGREHHDLGLDLLGLAAGTRLHLGR